ncbi:MAG TPA: hypothetical protein VL326_18110, partial [Kofleriaceae bacterium]|nr:hypothetical protein [Kofleriaceae bacterium]
MSRAVAPLLVIAACFDPPPPPGDFVESHTEQFEIPEYPPPNFDVLIVVDDTPAMASYQAHLAGLANELVAQLRLIYGGIPNLHLAVTTSAAGGAFRTTQAMTEPFLADSLQFDGSRTVNYQGTLDSVLADLLAVGAASTGANQPLDAIRVVVGASGFLRRDAYAGVLVVSASDDASPPDYYAQWLKGAYQDPYGIIVGGIYPPGSAQLDSFLLSFDSRHGFASIDAVDWSPAYEMFGKVIRIPLSGLRCS